LSGKERGGARDEGWGEMKEKKADKQGRENKRLMRLTALRRPLGEARLSGDEPAADSSVSHQFCKKYNTTHRLQLFYVLFSRRISY